MIEVLVGMLVWWVPAYFVGRALIRYAAKEIRVVMFGRPQDDPRYR